MAAILMLKLHALHGIGVCLCQWEVATIKSWATDIALQCIHHRRHHLTSLLCAREVRFAQWFTLAPLAYKGRWRNFHVFGTLSSGLNFNTFWDVFGDLFCCALSSCVYDLNHPYLVCERLFLAENKAFPYPRRAGANPQRAGAILWDAAAT